MPRISTTISRRRGAGRLTACLAIAGVLALGGAAAARADNHHDNDHHDNDHHDNNHHKEPG